MPTIAIDRDLLVAIRDLLDRAITDGACSPDTFYGHLQIADITRDGDDGRTLRPWVADVTTGSRQFLDCRRDYTHTDKKGRGVMRCYLLRPGRLYEVQEVAARWRKGAPARRYYCRVVNGAVEECDP